MFTNLSDEEYELKQILEPEEKILWMGKPGTGIVFSAFDFFMIPFSIVWGGFAFFWEYTAYTSGAPLFFLLFGVPFVIVGFYLIFGRFYADMRRRKNTVYTLTNKRILIKSGVKTKKLITIPMGSISEITFHKKGHGKGSVYFNIGKGANSQYNIPGFNFINSIKSPAFEIIEDAETVYNKINIVLNSKLNY